MRRLTHVDTREVSLVGRAANRRRFALLKQDPNEDLPGRGAGTGYDGLSRKRDIPAGERHGMPASDFAGEGESFPIRKPEDVAAAAHSLGRTSQDRDKVKARIISIARRKGPAFVAKLPEAWKVEKGETIMPRTLDLNDENIQTVLTTPLQGEEEIITKYAPDASDDVKAAMAASLRLLVAASEETGPEAIAGLAKAAFTKADDEGDDEDEKKAKAAEEEERKKKAAKAAEEEERKRKNEAEEEERKRKAAKTKGKAFPGAKQPFGGGGDDEEEERKRKMVAKAAEEAAEERDKKIARLEGDLATERSLRLQREAEAEAGQFPYVPVSKARLAELIRKADEVPVKLSKADGKGQETWGEAFRGLLKTWNVTMEKAGLLAQHGSDLVGNPGGARETINAMARERLTKAAGKESFEQAFSVVVRENPELYARYLKEEHPSRH